MKTLVVLMNLEHVILQCDKDNRQRNIFIEHLQTLQINWDLQSIVCSQPVYDFWILCLRMTKLEGGM